MYLGNLAFTALLAQASPGAIPPDSAQDSDTVHPVDTLPAIQLSESAFYVQDTSGVDRARLDSCYALLRTLLELAVKNDWRGEFSYDALAKRYPKVKQNPWFQPASFQLHPGHGAVYVSFMENEGFLPTIRLVNNPDTGLLEFSYSSSQGTSTAWAKSIPVK